MDHRLGPRPRVRHRRGHRRHRVERVPEQAARASSARAASPTRSATRPSRSSEATGAHGVINLPALGILLILTLLLIRGIQESATVNVLIVVHEGDDRHPHHRARLGLHERREPHAVHPGAGRVHRQAGRRARLRRRDGHPRRGRHRLLRVHRLRRRLDRGAGGEEPEARHAHRHPRLARGLHVALHPLRARADGPRAGRVLPHERQRGLGRRRPSTCSCPATGGSRTP